MGQVVKQSSSYTNKKRFLVCILVTADLLKMRCTPGHSNMCLERTRGTTLLLMPKWREFSLILGILAQPFFSDITKVAQRNVACCPLRLLLSLGFGGDCSVTLLFSSIRFSAFSVANNPWEGFSLLLLHLQISDNRGFSSILIPNNSFERTQFPSTLCKQSVSFGFWYHIQTSVGTKVIYFTKRTSPKFGRALIFCSSHQQFNVRRRTWATRYQQPCTGTGVLQRGFVASGSPKTGRLWNSDEFHNIQIKYFQKFVSFRFNQ